MTVVGSMLGSSVAVAVALGNAVGAGANVCTSTLSTNQ
jgi:hypothetical protein